MRVAREHAERASQLKSDFLSLVSHELKTPLASLKLQLERLRLSPEELPETTAKLVGRMFNSADRLQALIEGLLQYARLEAGRMRTNPSRFDARELTEAVVQELEPHAREKGLDLVAEIPQAPAEVTTDRDLTYLVLVNLVVNALKFTREGHVKVLVAPNDDGLQVEVSDTGPGIPAEDLARIFEPFEQLEPASKASPGRWTRARDCPRNLFCARRLHRRRLHRRPGNDVLGLSAQPHDGCVTPTKAVVIPLSGPMLPLLCPPSTR